ncbi:hypothetical protein LTR09_000679 [Extremus antarcticus]|uniref:Uncharacterized protein n=1 Tax=Extremus antarcticus TaxID=702011 RepID=A0AAJ0LXF2_9PEZI|nr:hypothetical protein LTR09_000679 [Extremus antarcticus]
MTGRVKYHTHPKPNLAARKPQAPSPPPPPSPSPPPPSPSPTPSPNGGADTLLSTNTADPKSQLLNKSTLTWLTILILLVLGTLILISCLLCRCKRRRKNAKGERKRGVNATGHSHHPSLEVTDGRNGFGAWNRNAPHQEVGGVGGGMEMVDQTSAGEGLTPLAKAAVKPAGFGNRRYGGEGMPEVRVVEVEDEGEGVSPLTARFERERGRRGAGSR